MSIDIFFYGFQCITCAMTILLGLYLSNPMDLDLFTILLLDSSFHFCYQYSCDPSPAFFRT